MKIDENYTDWVTAKKLKKLGFNQWCNAWYDSKGSIHFDNAYGISPEKIHENNCLCPLWSQVENWLDVEDAKNKINKIIKSVDDLYEKL